MRFIRTFDQISLDDIPLVGGKNASIGQMIRELSSVGVRVPFGFAITAEAYWEYVTANDLKKVITNELQASVQDYARAGEAIREAFVAGTIPDELRDEIVQAYHSLSAYYNTENLSVAVRSSATAEDLPHASFAGQQETFLNVVGVDELLSACKRSLASLFTNRAIFYRQEQGFDHLQVALSVGVQKMVRSDIASAGVLFTLDPQTGFKDVVAIESSFGLGESIVKGLVVPDEYYVFKTTLAQGCRPIVKKALGSKEVKVVFGHQQTATVEIAMPEEERNQFSLSDDEALELSRTAIAIESHYSEKKSRWMPMDIEWAKDGIDGKLYIVQARPETVHSMRTKDAGIVHYRFVDDAKKYTPLAVGTSIGNAIASGVARVITSVDDIDQVQEGDILVTYMSDPDWVPAMKKVAAIITERGGRTCHAAIVSRELGVPAIVGVPGAVEAIPDGSDVTVDCSQGSMGFVYAGAISFEKVTQKVTDTKKVDVSVMINIADPSHAYKLSYLPVDGVGLARIEFIIAHAIGVHPMALLQYDQLKEDAIKEQVKQKIRGYTDAPTFFVDQLAYGIGTIAAAFFPRPVLVRFSDFKTNEYRALLGGKQFEPVEENPMLGFRGAARYCNAQYEPVFALECYAFKKVRDQMGLKNIQAMVPFVRTVQEAQQVQEILRSHGLVSGKDDLKVIMMAEIPSNALLASDFIELFDGFSIGSNDLTQLVLGCDRDSALVSDIFDERDPAVVQACNMIITAAKQAEKYSGICGQGPSDYPEFAQRLIRMGIDSISLNPDAVLTFLYANGS